MNLGNKYPLNVVNGLYKGEVKYDIRAIGEGAIPYMGRDPLCEVYVTSANEYDVKENIDAIITSALDTPEAHSVQVMHRGPVHIVPSHQANIPDMAFAILAVGIRFKDGSYQMFSGGADSREIVIHKTMLMPKYTPKMQHKNETSDKKKVHAE